MITKHNLDEEWAEVSRNYEAKDSRGRDIIALVTRFADKVERTDADPHPRQMLSMWESFVRDNVRSMTVDMYQNILYLLITYWSRGEELWPILHPLEKLAVTELVYEFSEEIKKRSEAAAAG